MKSRGFTIVELLIVIVVIAILAAISIVAYNGIQQRAKNSQTVTAMAAYAKAIRGYHAVNQNFPGTTSCAGKVGSVCGNLTDNTAPAACSGIGPAGYEAAFGNAIKTISSTIPEPSEQEITCDGRKFKGIIYQNFGFAVALYSFYKSVNQCPAISGAELYTATSGPFGDGYMCAYTITLS